MNEPHWSPVCHVSQSTLYKYLLNPVTIPPYTILKIIPGVTVNFFSLLTFLVLKFHELNNKVQISKYFSEENTFF